MKPKRWIDCGEGILIHPVMHEPVKTRVIELEGFGRIAEVYHYGNRPEQDFKLVLAAPELLTALENLLNWGGDHLSPAHNRGAHELLLAAHHAIAKAKS